MDPLKKAFFHFSNSDFHTVRSKNGLIGQVLVLRVGRPGKGVSFAIGLAWSEDHLEVKL